MSETKALYMRARRRTFPEGLEFIHRREYDAQLYVSRMAEAVCTEVQRRGHCWLIDYTLAEGSVLSCDHDALLNARSQLLTPDDRRSCFTWPIVRYALSEGVEALLLDMYGCSADLQPLRQEQAGLEESVRSLREEEARLRQQNEALAAQGEACLRRAQTEADALRTSLLHGLVAEEAAALPPPPPEGTLRDSVEENTRRLENTVRDTLESYRNELHQMLNDFRTGLYRTDHLTLCTAYQKLYRFSTTILDRQIDSLCRQLEEEPARQAEEALRQMQGQLCKRLAALEGGLVKLGLTVFRPAPGEEYNGNLHTAENAEDDGFLETEILSCICPGVRYEEQVICPATVIVAQ